MAILKHSTSKNMSYGDAINYLQYKHREDPDTGFYKPILNQDGLYQERDNYALCYLNGYGIEQDPEEWVGACLTTNMVYHKNNKKEDRKQHMYVISHPASDCPLLTKEALLEEGKAFVRENLQGYDALIAVHMDTDHYHLHISFNSVRSVNREEQPWMMKDDYGNTLRCEMKAGCKHQNSPQFRRHCQQWLLDYTRKHGLTIEDNLQIEDQRKQERYASRNQELRSLILKTASQSATFEDLKEKLNAEQNILLVRRGKTWTLHLPGSRKGRRLKMLGLSEAELLASMEKSHDQEPKNPGSPSFQFEKKKYMEWLRHRRSRNAIRAEDAIASAAHLIAGRMEKSGQRYNPWEFRELNALLKQTTYLQYDLQTELDKLDHLRERWDQYRAAEDGQRETHESYLRWCGCEPSSKEEYVRLLDDIEVASLQIQEATSLRDALVETAEDWQHENQVHDFYYRQAWTISKEAQLKQQLKAVRANRKKLEQIAFHCEEAAYRRIYKKEPLEKAAYFREKWHQKLQQEDALKARIRELHEHAQAMKREAAQKKQASL